MENERSDNNDLVQADNESISVITTRPDMTIISKSTGSSLLMI